ncbi:hypothetical protein NQZ68_022476 [Dissostichus eleginoides]|nr:hypothetical protein NQZ68_022476 [Dissostichus eleginoides]
MIRLSTWCYQRDVKKSRKNWPQPGPSLAPAWPQPGPSLAPAWPQPGPSLAPAWPQPGPNLAPPATTGKERETFEGSKNHGTFIVAIQKQHQKHERMGEGKGSRRESSHSGLGESHEGHVTPGSWA